MSLLDGIFDCWSFALGCTGQSVKNKSKRVYEVLFYNMDMGTDYIGAAFNGSSFYAVDFDGSNDYAKNTYQISSAYPLTMSIWLRQVAAGNKVVFYIGKDDANLYTGHYLYVGSDGSVSANTANSSSFAGAGSSAGLMTYNVWHHLVGVYRSATDRKVYFDGLLVGSDTANMTPNTVDSVFIGTTGVSSSTAVAFFNGAIAECCVWTRPLADSEINVLYRLGPRYLGQQLTGQFNRRRVFFVPSAFSSKPPLIVNQAIKTSYLW